MYWLYNDGCKEEFDRVVDFVVRYLPGVTVHPPRETHDQPPRVEMRFEEKGVAYDIGASGGGLHALLSLGLALKLSGASCLLLDEPDAHLHSGLQREIASMLVDYTYETDTQVFVSTHAPDFIAQVPADALVWIDRSLQAGTKCDHYITILHNLGVLPAADALASGNSHRILLVEAGTDQKLLARMFKMAGYGRVFDDGSIVKAKLPNGKGDRKHIGGLHRLLRQLDPGAQIACVTDRDYEDAREGELESTGLLLLSLRRKEIENYLLDARAIADAAKDDLDRRSGQGGAVQSPPTAAEVGSAMEGILNDDSFLKTFKYQYVCRHYESRSPSVDDATALADADTSFDEKWRDDEWRMENCPGKWVLKRLREWCKGEYHANLSHDALLQRIGCPDDIKALAKKINDFFYTDA